MHDLQTLTYCNLESWLGFSKLGISIWDHPHAKVLPTIEMHKHNIVHLSGGQVWVFRIWHGATLAKTMKPRVTLPTHLNYDSRVWKCVDRQAAPRPKHSQVIPRRVLQNFVPTLERYQSETTLPFRGRLTLAPSATLRLKTGQGACK